MLDVPIDDQALTILLQFSYKSLTTLLSICGSLALFAGGTTMRNSVSKTCIKIAAAAIVTLSLLLGNSAFAQHYQRTNLTVDRTSISFKATLDPNLVNAWGLSRATGSPFWISDNGTGLSTLYDSTGSIVPLVVTIPTANGGTPPSAPTGTVFNFTTGFNVVQGVPAVFIFVTENGTIAAWNPTVNLNKAVKKVDHSASGAIFKGCAIAITAAGPRLYVNNFSRGRVEVYDSTFTLVPSTGFVDAQLPPDYAPFGIQNVGGNIVVTFAHRLPGSTDEDHGPGIGYVDIFDDQGALLLRLEHGPFMNAPWGIALAPSDFGPFSHRLLIGNFGDGRIHAFNAVSGKRVGMLLNKSGNPMQVRVGHRTLFHCRPQR